MNLIDWAQRWGIPKEALEELAMCHIPTAADNDEPESEARIQSLVRLEAAAATPPCYLWRNNVGAGKVNGAFIRWGLANTSEAINKKLKSADLIGIQQVLITQVMVGTYIGQFKSREIKRSGWKFSGSLEDHAQLNWMMLINSLGGDAKIVNGVGSI